MDSNAKPDSHLLQLEQCRAFFAREVVAVAGLDDTCPDAARLVRAFARVQRERFLGPPPWFVLPAFALQANYREIHDPRDLYHDFLVAMDRAKRLNNGQPSLLARLMAALHVAEGARVLHVGCGLGYFTAVLAELAGAGGSVLAVEVEAELAARAAQNLAPWPWVRVENADAATVSLPSMDAILVNAAVTHPAPAWLHALADGGAMVLPLSVGATDAASDAMAVLVERRGAAFAARPLCVVSIYGSPSLRDAAMRQQLRAAYASYALLGLRSLRLDEHTRDESCLAHRSDCCFSTRAPVQNPE